MKKLLSILVLLFVIACGTKEKEVVEENYLNAARNFIRAALDGKFEEARTYLLQDSTNTNYMDVFERSYQNFDKRTKDGYRASSIRINRVDTLYDTAMRVIYSNSFMNNPDSLKILRINGKWLVDLKYLYQH